jgi:hypothetical protein
VVVSPIDLCRAPASGAYAVSAGLAFVLGGYFLSEFPGTRDLLEHYLLNPWAAIGGSLTPLFRPRLWTSSRRTPILLSDTCCVLGSSTMGMKDGSLGHRFDLVHRADTSRDLLVAAFKDLPFIQLRPLDLLGWQLLWVGGLF